MRFRILTALLLIVLLAPSVYTQDDASRPAAKPARAPRAHPSSDRWKELGPAKRREIEKIYQQLRSLPADKQKQLLDKLRRMKPEDRRTAVRDARTRLAMPPHEQEMRKKHLEILRRTWKELPPAEQKRLLEMTPEAREKHLHARFMGQRKRIVDTLPTELRTRVRKMSPPEQAAFLRKHKAKVTAEKIFDSAEVAKLRSIDHKTLRRMFHPPRSDSAPQPRKPEFLSSTSWKKWNALKPYERPRVVGFILGKDRKRPPPGGANRRPPPEGRRPQDRGRGEPPGREEMLKRFDKNKDGKLDDDEREAARKFNRERESRQGEQRNPRNPRGATGKGGEEGRPPAGGRNGRPPHLRESNGNDAQERPRGAKKPPGSAGRRPDAQPRGERTRPPARPVQKRPGR